MKAFFTEFKKKVLQDYNVLDIWVMSTSVSVELPAPVFRTIS
jgi:hypothetical protein